MGKLIMFNLVTLDGYFEGATSWDLTWHQQVLSEEFHQFSAEQLRSADLLIFGRITYEGMVAYWSKETGEIADLMNSLPKLVFSRTLKTSTWQNTRIDSADPATAISDIKNNVARNILVLGSADLSTSLITAGLFDEYRIAVGSLTLGHGRPLFRAGANSMALRLLDSRKISEKCIVLCYQPQSVSLEVI